jgi:hypothetical protein
MPGLKNAPLAWFEMPREFVEPVIQVLRLGNCALDALFYDIEVLSTELLLHGSLVTAGASDLPSSRTSKATDALRHLDLSALSNPEGSILVVDARRPPYVQPYKTVHEFIDRAKLKPAVQTLTVTGVGSSALGSAAFAWDVSTALDEPVAAVVPGYGVADMVQQALCGWYGFGMYTWWVKHATQTVLANTAPQIASIGRLLQKSSPDHEEAPTGVPLFQRGNGSSDVLHSILRMAPSVTRVFGHSKGALVIENAIRDLPPGTAERLHVMTFGCPIAKDTPARYEQFLGLFDWLGLLNSWGNCATPILSHHSTNTWIPLSMFVSLLAGRQPVEVPQPAVATQAAPAISGRAGQEMAVRRQPGM